MSMNKIILKFIPFVLFLWCFTASVNGFAQVSDSTSLNAEVYPNPFSSTLTIKSHKQVENIEEIAIYDALGNVVQVFDQQDWQEEEFEWNGGSLPNGPYIFYMRTKEETESIVIQKI